MRTGKYFSNIFMKIGQVFSFSTSAPLEQEWQNDEEALKSDWNTVGDSLRNAMEIESWLNKEDEYYFLEDAKKTPMKIVSIENGIVRMESKNGSHVCAGRADYMYNNVSVLR